MDTQNLSKRALGALLQDAYHYALMAKGGKAKQFSEFQGDRNGVSSLGWFLRCVNRCEQAGMTIDNAVSRQNLPKRIATFAAARGIDAYTGEPREGSPESILTQTRGL